MKFLSRGLLILLLLLILTIAGVLTIGRTFLLNQLASRVEQQLQKLRDAGYIVAYDSIKIDWQKNTLEIHRLSVKSDIDSGLCNRSDFISAKYIRAEGF